MTKVEITVPEVVMKKTGEYVCECQRTKIDMKEKEAKVFWIAKLNDIIEEGKVVCELDTGKTVAEIQSPCAGRLLEIRIRDAGNCTLGSILGILETD